MIKKEPNIREESHVKHWRALYVNSRSEKKVLESLLHKNIEAYVPLIKTMKQWSDRKKMVELPLLNGYVFVNLFSNQNSDVLQTKGVVSFVKYCGKIAQIRNNEIERLKQIVNLGYDIEVVESRKNYDKGEQIKIISGPLKGIEGFVLEKSESKFVEIALEGIGQSLRVKLPAEFLEHKNVTN